MRFIALHGHGMNPVLFKSLLKSLLSRGPFKHQKAHYVKGWYSARGDGLAYSSDRGNGFAYSSDRGDGFAYYRYNKRDKIMNAEKDYGRLDKMLGDSETDNILIGFSEGGRFALNYAIRYPHKVKALILMCFPFPEPDKNFMRARGPLHVPAIFVTSPTDAIVCQQNMEAVRGGFAERPEVLVHDKGHKVDMRATIRQPLVGFINVVTAASKASSRASSDFSRS